MLNKRMCFALLGVIFSIIILFAVNVASFASEKVVVYSAGPGGLAQEIAQGFEDKTGIKVDLYQATTGKVLGRLEAEKSNPVADVVVLASWPAAMGLKNQGLLMQYSGAKNSDKLNKGWNDNNYYFGYSASALGITYNTNLLKNPGKDWADYTKKDFRSQVSMPDPSQSGSALDFVCGYISNNPGNGWDLFQNLKENKISVAGSNRPALNTVITGGKAVVLAGVDYMAFKAMKDGEPVNIIYPKSGTVVNPRPAMILKTAHNIQNAKKFIDYILSDEAQKMVADNLIIPGRADIPVSKDRIPYDKIPQFKIDWEWMSEHQTEINSKFHEIIR